MIGLAIALTVVCWVWVTLCLLAVLLVGAIVLDRVSDAYSDLVTIRRRRRQRRGVTR